MFSATNPLGFPLPPSGMHLFSFQTVIAAPNSAPPMRSWRRVMPLASATTPHLRARIATTCKLLLPFEQSDGRVES